MDEITKVMSALDEKASELSMQIRPRDLYLYIPHLSIRICNELSKDH